MSDVRYAGQAALDRFGSDPELAVKAHLLGDIDMLVDRSTTYLALGTNAHTFKDAMAQPVPLGPAAVPTYSLFVLQRSDQAEFRTTLTALAQRWAQHPGVLRLRLSLFEVPDMEAERKAGYPIKTHPLAQQYQAWIDLSVEDPSVCRNLVIPNLVTGLAQAVAVIHTYPVEHVYTFNYAGKPTLAGLRGYCAVGPPGGRAPGPDGEPGGTAGAGCRLRGGVARLKHDPAASPWSTRGL